MIAKWHLKALVQKTISFFPYKEKCNYFFQKNVTKGVNLTDYYFEIKVMHARDHLNYFKDLSANTNNKNTSTLEIGTGWYPIVPISFFLCGYDQLISIDLQNWLTKKSLFSTIEKFLEREENGKLYTDLPLINKNQVEKLKSIYQESQNFSLEEILARLKLKYIVGDINTMNLELESINYISSNNTFEHIEKESLEKIIALFYKLLKPNGIMSHFIDMTDHFAHFDRSISTLNFLKFSDKHWKIIDNSIQSQNRMRFKDFVNIYKENLIPITKEKTESCSLEVLKNLTVDKKFNTYSLEELAISHAYIVSKKIS